MKVLFLLLIFLSLFLVGRAQNLSTVGGKVTDEAGKPIAGVSIVVRDGNIGSATDVNGFFSFKVPVETRFLSVSYVGMKTVRITPGENLHIILRPEINELDELVVVAYGTVRKNSLTGSVATVRSGSFKERPVTVATNVLEGLVPGVQTGEGNGQPGAELKIRIRGFGSINADNEPIYVLDGAIYNGALCDINPGDIESFTILKDAAATALYGSGAGNGVVLITTRSARSETPTISFSMKQGFNNRAIPEYDRIDIWDYYPLQWEMMRNGLTSGGKSEAEAAAAASAGIYNNLKYNPFMGVANDRIVTEDGRLNPGANTLLYGNDLDWEDAISRNGYRSEYNVAYQMKGAKGDLYASLGYLKENGYVIKSDIERFSARVNGNIRPLRWLKTGLNLNFTRTNCHLANTRDNPSDAVNPFYFTRYMGPIYPIHQHDMTSGDYIVDAFGNKLYDYDKASRGTGVATLNNRNIVAETLSNKDYFERNVINGRTYVDIYLFDGLKATANLTIDSYDSRRNTYDNNVAASSPGRLYSTNTRTTTLTANQLLNYGKTFGRHSVTALAGHESYSFKYEYLYGRKTDQMLEGVYEMANFLTLGALSSSTDTYRKEGYFLQAAYSYDHKYDFSVSWRHDGTSRFSEDNRWGNFWSVGAAWRIDRESFMEKVEFVDYLKIRASYGETGNDNVLRPGIVTNTFSSDYYPYQTLYNLGLNNAYESGTAFYRFGNPDLKWETQISSDIALEFGLLHWLTGSIEYFQKDSRDLLFDVPQVLSAGTSSIWKNVGEVSNKGVELALDFGVIQTSVWKWNVGINATFLKNKVKKMPESQPEITDATRSIREGKPLYNFWLKEYRGVNPDNGDAQYTFDGEKYRWNDKVCFVNAEGDSLTYNSAYAKYHYAGTPIPKVYGGITTSLSYKNIDLSAILAYSLGGKVYNTGYQVLMYNGKYGQAMHSDISKRWQKPGDVTDVPRLDDAVKNERTGLTTATQINDVSDRWLCDAGFLNVKSITLRYRLGKALLDKYGIREADIFVSGENLYLFTAMNGLDPRQLFKGVISISNTPARTFTFGLSLTL